MNQKQTIEEKRIEEIADFLRNEQKIVDKNCSNSSVDLQEFLERLISYEPWLTQIDNMINDHKKILVSTKEDYEYRD